MSEIVDLSKLPAPKVLEELDYETLLAERKAKFLSLYPESERAVMAARLALESEPITKLLQENCYLQLLERQRINSAAQATMLAYATGTDLDVIAANFNVERLVVQAEDLTASPPIVEELEPDDDFRQRVQLKIESVSVAGPRKAYTFHALSANGKIADVSVISPQPAYVTVTLLSRDGNGAVASEIINAAKIALNDEEVRPIADRVTVQGASIVEYEINAVLHLYRGPEKEPILKAAKANLEAYINQTKRIGRDVTHSGIHAALHVAGVQNVEILQPRTDLVLTPYQAGYCVNYTLNVEVSDEYS
ncbi:TPA: baseplate assembly protein [Mannheimia haemolytica]|uniref:Baseplate assembly protein J n=5 Tax=root TaxID=1 RepID=R9QCI8_9CAUD|nr:baseplate assembly protein [Mannheimia haemolytica]YP_655488.1 baseplate protein [Mannheimia phage PHL101]ABD90621.1 baseplate assembly protein J [Mannheimia phage phiMhaA1-BAA410]AFL46467.1 baseplate assembly protein J [Mannheimia phage vB_MhM_1152AP]AJA73124.1 baseplate assembly protein J [Mannheimia phage vB_MhM_2256AP1]AWW71399.1 baseplate assembly protein [Pasteurellaceae bacterium 12565]ABD90572.1 baseplate assembly protein J [Mannheimia phage PHL101]